MTILSRCVAHFDGKVVGLGGGLGKKGARQSAPSDSTNV